MKILLAEDNPVNQRVTQGLLERQGHQVVVAADGGEATEILEDEEGFDLVLMDIQMPGVDGYVATQIIRDREAKTGGHIPIVALTAHAMKGDRERTLKAGMDAYLSKPVSADDLYAMIRRFSGGASSGSSGESPTRRGE